MEHRGAVVVGLGDAGRGVPELDWAAREARIRNRPLHVVRAYHLSQGTLPWESSADRMIVDELRGTARSRLGHALEHVRQVHPDVEVEGFDVDGVPWKVVIEASQGAELTVLGSRRLGPFAAAFLGSVSSVVAAAAAGPVVLVGQEPNDTAEHPAVIVGVDGGDSTDTVLDHAFDHASRHGAPLHALFCWSPDLLASMQWRPKPPAPERADRWLAEMLAGWQEKHPDVQVHRGVVREHPVTALASASLGQELLVVGARSRHARTAAMLGSVSQGVLHHATCPVAVVHPRAGSTAAD